MKVLVIDDEPLIHISIEKLIHKYSDAIEVYHAYNGQEMQTLMQSHDFLLAYVDIKLPGISGLEAIRIAKESAPNTTFYIMTGFDSFEFAREAIKLKVEDYLMKPLDYETIKNTILSAQDIHTANKRERKNMFRYWLESTLNNREFPLVRYDDYYLFSILITTDLDDFPPEALLDKLMPYNDNFVSIFIDNRILILCFSKHVEMLRNINKALSTGTYSHGITLFVSSIVKSSYEMKTAIDHLMQYSCLRIILGMENCYAAKPLLNYEDVLVEFCRVCEEWQNMYMAKKYNEVVTLNEDICNSLENNPLLKKYQGNVISFFQTILGENLSASASIDELRKYLQKGAAKLLQSSGNERLVSSIIQYIKEHCCDNISTTMLSDQFGLSSNYITNLLKQELGIRYNDFITQLRMEHAKELLLTTNHSVKTITTECGYYSQSHFTKLFVDREGCTPTEYRKKHKIDSNT